ncbi:2-keto-4-pentenoate hydratase [Bauldia sp.]|uniref:2-keto-4-pentenoate hydratase n=1 Tax=Bauldia sp. TaxID=2575872 RepID=UPI003BACCDE7
MTDRIASAADRIAAARRLAEPLAVLPAAIRPRNEAEAYAVQDAVHERLPELGRRVGTKIGCTTPVMQTYLGIPNPCAAGVFANSAFASGVTLNAGDYRRIGVECEIAVRLGRDLGAAEAPFSAATVADAVSEYMAAVEIVDDRYADWRTTDTPTLIAGDFFAAGCVLGRPVPAPLDVRDLVGVTTINDAEVGRGVGRDVMGDPLNALAWLADNFAARGELLRAGDIVLTGSLVETRWLAAGDRVTIAIDGLGDVSLSVV